MKSIQNKSKKLMIALSIFILNYIISEAAIVSSRFIDYVNMDMN